jgi:hypothetical protein
MHTMQENDGSNEQESHGNGYLEGPERHERHKSHKSLQLVAVAVAGMLLPLITQIGHAH